MRDRRILLVDDHALVRAGIRALLEKLAGVTVLGEASDGREALALLRELRPDVVLSDIAMQGIGGLVLTTQICREHPEVKVLVLSMHANEEYVVHALRAGAAGYLLKDAVVDELELALAAIGRGEIYLSPAISRQVLRTYLSGPIGTAAPANPLTPRQRETLRMIAEGKNTKEIAHQMGLSAKTVETHRAQLMERLGIHEVAGLVKYALRTGVIE